MRNFVDLVRDAITKSLSVLMGALASKGRLGQAVQSRAGEVGELGTTLVSAMANAFEPLLERHIGKPVIIAFDNPQGASEPVCEFPGYLVDYTEEYVAVFNVDQEPEETFEVKTAEPHSRDNMQINISGAHVKISCSGPDALVLHSVSHSGRNVELGVVLMPGCSMEFDLIEGEPITVSAERTRKLDWVCPRSRARVQFGSDPMAASQRRWAGAGASPEAARDQSDSLPGDQ